MQSRTNDLLAANPAGFRLLPGLAEWPARQRNTIRYTFLHPAAWALWPDWEQKARGCVAHLHAVAGADPDAPDLAAIIGELVVKSPDFSRLWDRYEVRRIGDGEKVFRHPRGDEICAEDLAVTEHPSNWRTAEAAAATILGVSFPGNVSMAC